MKKLIACLVAFTLIFSVTLLAACAETEQAGTDEQYSEQESTSSARQRHSGAGSVTGNTSNSAGGGSSAGSAGSVGGNSSQSTAPTSNEYTYGNYDYTYSNTPVSVEYVYGDKVAEADALIYLFVTSDYKKPVLTENFYNALVGLESQYNALTATQKGQVQNASLLFEARAAYEWMACNEAETLIGELPDPTLDNITDFGTKAAAIASLVETVTDISPIKNYATYQSKVESSSVLLVDAFNDAVAAIATFEYSAEYKAKLDYAAAVYAIMNDTQKSRVATNYSTLSSMQTKYANRDAAQVFADALAAIADENNLTDADKATVKELKKQFKNLTEAVVNEIPAAAMTKYNTMVKTANTLWPEYYINFMTDPAGGNEYFKVYKSDGGVGELGGTSDGENYPAEYDGDSLTKAYKFKTDRYIIIETDAPAVLTIVANYKKGSGDITVKSGTLSFNSSNKASFTAGDFSTSFTVSMGSGEDTNYVVNLPAAGTYQLSSGDSNVMVYYMIYQ